MHEILRLARAIRCDAADPAQAFSHRLRIGLLVALVFTMRKTEAATGRIIPLIAGVVFVAVILPSTLPDPTGSLTEQILAGLVSNAIILAVVLAGWALATRLRR